jgi:hypothetical protein
MAANYPNTIKVWDPKVNLRDLVVAEDVNTVYEELEAVQRQLGAGGVATSAIWGTSGDVNTSTTNWGSLRARIQNIENGVFFAVSRRGGSVITPAETTRVGLTVAAVSGQTANLLELRNSSNQAVATWAANGAFTGTIDGGTA